jgi:hypothetical protein
MRDLRSALSFLLLRDHSCDDIAALFSRHDGDLTIDVASLSYHNAFADVSIHHEHQSVASLRSDETAVDRLVQRLRDIDVGLVNSPVLDRRLDHDPTLAVPWMTFEGRSGEAWRVMLTLSQNVTAVDEDEPRETVMTRRRQLQALFRRWAYC